MGLGLGTMWNVWQTASSIVSSTCTGASRVAGEPPWVAPSVAVPPATPTMRSSVVWPSSVMLNTGAVLAAMWRAASRASPAADAARTLSKPSLSVVTGSVGATLAAVPSLVRLSVSPLASASAVVTLFTPVRSESSAVGSQPAQSHTAEDAAGSTTSA